MDQQVYFIIDTSGSMNRHIQMMQKYLRALSNSTPYKLFTYNDTVSELDNATQMYATGGTNINDSICEVLAKAISAKHDKALLIFITDGENGHSKNSPADVSKIVSYCEDILGYDFLFIGTNTDAMVVGAKLGVKPGKALSFVNGQKGFELMLADVQSIIVRWSGGSLAHNDEFFTSEMIEKHAKL